MILQVFADAVEFGGNIDPQRFQFVARADAAQQQEVRGPDGSGRHDHFASGTYLAQAAVLRILDSHGSPVFEENPRHVDAGPDGEIAAAERGLQKRVGGAEARTVLLRDAIEAGALLRRSVEIGVGRDARLFAGRKERARERIDAAQFREGQLALGGLEERDHVREAPADISHGGPRIEVRAASANVDHRVHGTGSAQHFSARPVEAAAVQEILRLSREVPVDIGFEEFRKGGGDVDFAFAIGGAGFDEQDGRRGIFGEAGSEHTSGAAGSNYDVIEHD